MIRLGLRLKSLEQGFAELVRILICLPALQCRAVEVPASVAARSATYTKLTAAALGAIDQADLVSTDEGFEDGIVDHPCF